MRRDARGGKGGYGQFFSLLGAYRIDRKTGIRAVIRPENIVNRGPLDRDIKTESIQFNERFHVSGRPMTKRDSRDVTQEVLQILTPATQASMLDLAARFHNLGFIVEDDVLFFMAQDRLAGENASEGGIDRLLPGMLEEFEAAKLSISATSSDPACRRSLHSLPDLFYIHARMAKGLQASFRAGSRGHR